MRSLVGDTSASGSSSFSRYCRFEDWGKHWDWRSTSTYRRTFARSSSVKKCASAKVEERLKTVSARREIDVHLEIAALLRAFTAGRNEGFVFRTKSGKPLCTSNILRLHLHPALKEAGYLNPSTGDSKVGSHAFRRFRNTYLRNRTTCPEGVRKFWLGHAGENMSDLYDKIKEDVPFRRQYA